MTSPTRLTTYYSLILIIGFLTILPFLFLNLYNNPSYDDYRLAVRDQVDSFWATQLRMYFTWSGRYFSTAVSQLNPLIRYDFTAYKYFSFSILLLFIGAVITFFYSLLSKYFKINAILALAAFVLIILLVQMPDIAQGVYWFSAYMAYTSANILIILLFGILLKFASLTSKPAKLSIMALALCIVIAIIGSNELSLIILLSSLLLALFIAWQHQSRRVLLFVGILFTVSLALSIFVVLAPGNFVRMAHHKNPSHYLYSVAGASALTLFSFVKWGLLMLVSSLVYIKLWGLKLARKLEHSLVFKCNLQLAGLWYLATLFLMQFVLIWSTGLRAGSRVENVIHFFFVFGWFYILQLILNKYAASVSKKKLEYSKAHLQIVMVMFCMMIFNIESNTTTAYLDLFSGRAAQFDRELTTRYSYLQRSNCNACAIAPVSVIPKSLFTFSSINPEELAELGINKWFAVFWKKTHIYLTGPMPAIPENIKVLKQLGKDIQEVLFGIKN